ncbi:MAG: class I SAM-dependent methyltransferase [Anaerolineales bacterium]|nr:class I SAM-dependent methyltransferase [Anaerolineales bacterium]
MRILHLGCGKRKHANALGVDLYTGSDADVIADLNQIPYPFSCDTFDIIICEHILEHLEDLIRIVEEIHRVAKAGAKFIVEVPHFSSVYYFQDPTHRHSFTSRTFDYFIPGTAVYDFGYSSAKLKLIKVKFPPPQNASLFKRLVFSIINRYIDSYEKRLAFILPRHLIHFELQIVK